MKKVLIVCLGNICCLFIVEVVFCSCVKVLGVNVKVDFVGIIGYY